METITSADDTRIDVSEELADRSLSRRAVLGQLGGASAVLGSMSLAGCGSILATPTEQGADRSFRDVDSIAYKYCYYYEWEHVREQHGHQYDHTEERAFRYRTTLQKLYEQDDRIGYWDPRDANSDGTVFYRKRYSNEWSDGWSRRLRDHIPDTEHWLNAGLVIDLENEEYTVDGPDVSFRHEHIYEDSTDRREVTSEPSTFYTRVFTQPLPKGTTIGDEGERPAPIDAGTGRELGAWILADADDPEGADRTEFPGDDPFEVRDDEPLGVSEWPPDWC